MQRRVSIALGVLLAGCGAAWGAQAPTSGEYPLALTEAPAAYDVLADHLCSDSEYLSCLAVSGEQCRNDLEAEAVRQCGQQAYASRLPERGEPGSRVPAGMVECVYVAHVDLRRRNTAAVTQCLAQAKLEQPGGPGPVPQIDQPGN